MDKGINHYTGVSESRLGKVAGDILNNHKGKGFIVVSSLAKAKSMAKDLSFFVHKNIFVLPEDESSFLRYEAKSREDLWKRMAAMKAILGEEEAIIIAPISACLKKLPPKDHYKSRKIHLQRGVDYDFSKLGEELVRLGYERLPMINDPGQFSIRGSIVDIFSPDAEEPYRVEFDDQEVESIRTFEPDTQRSLEQLKSITVYPATQMPVDIGEFQRVGEKIEAEFQDYIRKSEKEDSHRSKELLKRKEQLVEAIQEGKNSQTVENYVDYFYPSPTYLWDYLNQEDLVLIDDPERIYQEAKIIEEEGSEELDVLISMGRAIPKDRMRIKDAQIFMDFLRGGSEEANRPKFHVFTPFSKKIPGVERVSQLLEIKSRQGPSYNGSLDSFAQDVKDYDKRGYQIIIACATEERINNLKELLDLDGLGKRIRFELGTLTSGMEFPQEKLLILWDGDIFVSSKQRKSKKGRAKEGEVIKAFSDLQKGDFVVHESHGVGKFIGMDQLTVEGSKKDYLKIKYAGEDVLYIPVEQMDFIQKYIGSEGAAPKVNKMSGSEWKRTKANAKAAILDMARELLEISATRKALPGYAFGPDTTWQAEFEEQFPFEETDDQLRCIQEIKDDMERPEAMDRLLCGDVGFGKTEVAARAVFKAIAEGKQAAILVPTTLLANQHYHTLKERFERFPFKLEMLSRFRSTGEQKKIVEDLKKGRLDVIIGTHRLLSKDVDFKDLGLLVIDEEQRFGVKHKETMKALRKNVDVLALSATPIPRTLHTSLVGIKSMSLIEDPPEERYPVQTYVMEDDDLAMKEAIEKELRRGGQVYIVYNRVRGIHRVANHISSLVPDARIGVGHGQMNERELEDVMLSFVEGEKDILISTTIIEAGLDIPNVNTILILEADHYGLSQLYQLRGRVGRSNRLAYAYLLYKRGKLLSEAAEKRLKAIKEFTELGAGFKVSMRDLEIRGAGNLIGTEQSGHMITIGYELYVKLVDEAVRALKGEAPLRDKEDTSVEIKVNAYIPGSYIPDEMMKLQMYKKIADVENTGELKEVKEELMDRFGELPTATEDLLLISLIRSLSENLAISKVTEEQNSLLFHIAKDNPIKPLQYGMAYEAFGSEIEIKGGLKPVIRLRVSSKDKLQQAVGLLEILSKV